MRSICMTSINAPTDAVRQWVAWCKKNDWTLVVAGDRKTPEKEWAGIDCVFLPVGEQRGLEIPLDNYARKNYAYLYAIEHKAELIFETDDDNYPGDMSDIGSGPIVKGEMAPHDDFCNVFSMFGVEAWPRGFPLDAPRTPGCTMWTQRAWSPIQQYMCDDEPDVDAIFRLTRPHKGFHFQRRGPVIMPPGTYCPFNSQMTLWYPEAYHLMYIPANCAFRCDDIIRGYVAQRLLWTMNGALTFKSPAVTQKRNPHNLLKDFESEIPLYLHAGEVPRLLSGVHDLEGAYDALDGTLVDDEPVKGWTCRFH